MTEKYTKILKAYQDAFDLALAAGDGVSKIYTALKAGKADLIYKSLNFDQDQGEFLEMSNNKKALVEKLKELAGPTPTAAEAQAAFDTWKYGAAAAVAVCRPAYLIGQGATPPGTPPKKMFKNGTVSNYEGTGVKTIVPTDKPAAIVTVSNKRKKEDVEKELQKLIDNPQDQEHKNDAERAMTVLD